MGFKVLKKILQKRFARFQPPQPKTKELHQQTLCTGGKTVVTMIRGEGCGPEVTSYVEEVFNSAGVPVTFDVQETQAKTDEQRQENLQNIIASINKTGIAIAGFLHRDTSKSIAQSSLLNITLKRNRSYHPLSASEKLTIDNIMIRSMDEYSNAAHARNINFHKDTPLATVNSFIKNTEAVTRFAFELAKREKRLKLTSVHETLGELSTDVISLDIVEKIALQYYPFVKFENVDLKRWLRQLAEDPGQFDVLLLHNFHPGVRYDLWNWIEDATVLTETQKFGRHVVFEAMEEKFCRNPIPMLSAGVHMLEHMGLHSHARLIRDAIHATVCRDGIRTMDHGGTATSRTVVDYINNFIGSAKSDYSFA